MFFKKRLKISPIFFFKNTGLNPKNETKIEGNTLGYYYTLDYSLLLRKKRFFFFSIKKIEVNGPQFKKKCDLPFSTEND